MKELSLNQMSELEGGKFWGWEQGPTTVNMNDYENCDGGPSTSYTMTHYIFWIPDESYTVVTCWDAPIDWIN